MPRSTLYTRAGSMKPCSDFQVSVVTFGCPGKSILKPSWMFWYSAHSCANADPQTDNSKLTTMTGVRMAQYYRARCLIVDAARG